MRSSSGLMATLVWRWSRSDLPLQRSHGIDCLRWRPGGSVVAGAGPARRVCWHSPVGSARTETRTPLALGQAECQTVPAWRYDFKEERGRGRGGSAEFAGPPAPRVGPPPERSVRSRHGRPATARTSGDRRGPLGAPMHHQAPEPAAPLALTTNVTPDSPATVAACRPRLSARTDRRHRRRHRRWSGAGSDTRAPGGRVRWYDRYNAAGHDLSAVAAIAGERTVVHRDGAVRAPIVLGMRSPSLLDQETLDVLRASVPTTQQRDDQDKGGQPQQAEQNNQRDHCRTPRCDAPFLPNDSQRMRN